MTKTEVPSTHGDDSGDASAGKDKRGADDASADDVSVDKDIDECFAGVGNPGGNSWSENVVNSAELVAADALAAGSGVSDAPESGDEYGAW